MPLASVRHSKVSSITLTLIGFIPISSDGAFTYKFIFLAERFKQQKKMFQQGGGYVQDRSIYEDTGIFAKMHADKGTMTKVDYETYTSLFEAMVMTPYFPHPDALLYIDGSLEDILHRIQLRGRKMEQDTPRAYWEEMYARYDVWIASFNACPVVKVNINDYDLLEDKRSVEHVVAKLGEAIQS